MSIPPQIPSPTSATNSADRVRLHITPFNPELLEKYLAPSVHPSASQISFHTVQTFPERGFGFVELPAMEAQKLKKKLNGSTLKGTKVRVEDAKPEKKRRSSEDGSVEDADRKARKAERKERKARKREEGVIEGVELEKGRRVKRGWKEERASGRGDDKRRKAKSKPDDADDDLNGKKLRFKTTLPPTPNSAGMDAKIKKNKEKSEDAKSGKKKVVLEEFSNHIKPLPSSAAEEGTAQAALNYEDGRGWVDEAGNLIQPGSTSSKSDARPSAPLPERRISAIESREVPDEVPEDTPMQQSDASQRTPDPETPISPAYPEASSPAEAEAGASKSVHPLEALFKRPAARYSPAAKPRPKPINTSFTFFSGGGEGDEEMADADMPPQTPHTKRDLEWRSIRSAAPTPDTAAIGKRFSFSASFAPSEGSADESDGVRDEEMNADAGAVEDVGRPGESAWRKSFYENRGDLSREWRKRRRDEKKGQRQRENRRLSRRVV